MPMEELLTFEEYVKTKHPTPYFYTINKSDKQFLYYFGATHSFESTHPQFEILEKKWRDFTNKTAKRKRNRILLVEYLIDEFNDNRQSDIILKYGEAGFAIHLAKKDKINFKCPEPPIKYQIKELLKSYDVKKVVYFYFIRNLGQWYKLKLRPKFERYAGLVLQNLRHELGWLNFDFSLTNIKKTHRIIFKKKLKEKYEEIIKEAASPVKYNSIINEIARTNSMYRNRYIVKEIKKLWNDGKSIFIVYGSTHAVIQRKELEKLPNEGAVRNGRHKS